VSRAGAPRDVGRDRRRLLAAAVALAILPSPVARAQARKASVGILAPTSPKAGDGPDRLEALLRERARADGRSLVVARRYAEGNIERMPALARELATMPVDVMVVVGAAGARAARDASATLPIVFYGNFDPVAAGLVASLSRPGGSLTGVLISADGTLAAKRFELLREAVPGARRIGVLVPPDPNIGRQVDEIRRAGAASGVAMSFVEVRGADYEGAFAKLAADKPAALFVAAHTFFVRDRDAIIALALRHRLPTMFEWPEQAEAGGLLAYGASLADMYQRVADYVVRILDGAKPGELPVQRPERYELVINLATAQKIGLTVPQSLLLRADRVIR
jgi:putative ABC transport system substrate-binding protein